MADISIEKGKAGADLTWIWALAAIAATAGLMVWLFMSRPAETAVVTDSQDTTAVAEAEAEPVELATLAATPDQYTGRTVEITNLPVSARLGTRVFWAQPESGSPVLVVVRPEVSDVAWVNEGSSVQSVEGTIQPVTEAELDRLVGEQALLAEGRSQAVFATHYLGVTSATP